MRSGLSGKMGDLSISRIKRCFPTRPLFLQWTSNDLFPCVRADPEVSEAFLTVKLKNVDPLQDVPPVFIFPAIDILNVDGRAKGVIQIQAAMTTLDVLKFY